MQRSQGSFSAGLRGTASMPPGSAPRGSAGLGRSVTRGASLPAWRARELEDDMHQLVCLPAQHAVYVSHQCQPLGWHAHQQRAAQQRWALALLSPAFRLAGPTDRKRPGSLAHQGIISQPEGLNVTPGASHAVMTGS